MLDEPAPVARSLVPHRATTVMTAAVAVLMLLLTGCAPATWDDPRPATTAMGAPLPGFAPSSSPSPEATVNPAPGSWRDLAPSPGYRVVLLSGASDASTTALSAAVTQWATRYAVDLRVVVSDGDAVSAIVHAMDLKPELIVTIGDGLIDALAMVTPNHLGMSFLVLGAELAEPTANVTAVDWTGAGFRGEGLGSATHFDETSFTPERCADAIQAGTAAVLTGMTGVVLWIG